jgi:hypothetical protein
MLLAGTARASTDAKAAAHDFVNCKPGESLTEYLLTSPMAFGLTGATPAQRAICRILDGVPLGNLAPHPDVLALVGGEAALQALPSERGEQPPELVLLAAIRAAKTMIACAAALRMAMTVDVSGVDDGQTIRVSLLSLKLGLARKALRQFVVPVQRSPELQRILVDKPRAESLWVAHPTGRAIEITIAAGSKAGGNLVSDWSAGVVFDEAPRMDGASDAVVNLDDARTAVLGRLLPGAQALYIGSPWSPHGPVYDMVEEGWEKPTSDRVVLRGTGPMLNPVWWTPERCDRLLRRRPAAYQTDVLGEFASPEGGLILHEAVKQYTRELDAKQHAQLIKQHPHLQPGDVPRIPRGQYFAAIDPSDGTDHGNPWTLTIVERATVVVQVTTPEGDPALTATDKPITRIRNRFSVVAVREWRGERPAKVIAEVAQLCGAYGLRRATTDQYAGAALADLATAVGFHLEVRPWTGPRKVQAFTNLATLIAEGLVELHPDRQFQRDLLSVRKRTTQQGVAIVFPRMGDGRHCDYAPALASAIEAGGSSAQTLAEELVTTGAGSRWGNVPGRGFG